MGYGSERFHTLLRASIGIRKLSLGTSLTAPSVLLLLVLVGSGSANRAVDGHSTPRGIPLEDVRAYGLSFQEYDRLEEPVQDACVPCARSPVASLSDSDCSDLT